MKEINNNINEISMSAFLSKQNSQINILNHEKFSSFLNNEDTASENKEELKHEISLKSANESLRNQANLNKLIMESVA